MAKDWVTRHSGTIGHSVARLLVAWALKVLGTVLPRHSVARHSVATSDREDTFSFTSIILVVETIFLGLKSLPTNKYSCWNSF